MNDRLTNLQVADLYILLLNGVLQDPDQVPHGREGFYFAENGEHTFYEIAKAIGEGLLAIGISPDAEPSSFSKEEIDKYLFVSDRMTLLSTSSDHLW